MLVTTRHKDIFKPEQALPVFIVGCGATGSHIAMQLFCLGITENIHVIDFDTVEPHNLANQIFIREDIGRKKVNALMTNAMYKLGGDQTQELELNETFAEGTVPDDFNIDFQFTPPDKPVIVILAVDTMEARIEIVDSLRGSEKDYIIIDPRMAATHGLVYTFNLKTQYNQWEDTLIPDEHAEVSACGAAISVIPTVQFLSSLVVWEYLKRCINPAAAEDKIDFYLNPLSVVTSQWRQ